MWAPAPQRRRREVLTTVATRVPRNLSSSLSRLGSEAHPLLEELSRLVSGST